MTDVVVVGSANVDVVLAVERIPRPGETVLASGLTRGPGGKGANQAVAAARAGAGTTFVAALGDDDGGRLLRDALAEVDLSLVRTSTEPTGTAIITVDDSGENAITVAPSANADLVLDDESTAAVRGATVMLAQLEIPFDTVRAAAEAGRYVILNAAPAATLAPELLARVDLLVVNEHEASIVSAVDADPTVTGQALLDQVPAVVVTLGADGALILRRDTEPEHVPGFSVPVVDTTAASLTVQRPGAIGSIPDATAIQAALP